MALSNWDTMAFGPDGKPCNGVLKAVVGNGYIEIYKNWLYYHNKEMIVKDSMYSGDTITEINSGLITIDHMTIHAARGRYQQAVYMLAYSWKYGKTTKETVLKAMCGIGCYGWSDDEAHKLAHAMNVNIRKYKDVYTGSGRDKDGVSYHCLTCIKEDGTMEDFRLNKTPENEGKFDPVFIGVRYETEEGFFEWLEEEIDKNVAIFDRELKEWYTEVQKNRGSGLRFNQGDQYFAKHLGFETPATKVGEQEDTILTGVIKEMAKKK
jgi:hypothetical protein